MPNLKPRGIVVSATKGLEKQRKVTPLTYAQSELNIPAKNLCVISGPSFAKDLAEQTPISLVCASTDRDTASHIASRLSSDTVRCYTSLDPLGVELGGILKNVIAIAVGISDALSYGPSTRAALITRGLAEMTRIAVSLGAHEQTLNGLSGLGDLVMTATDDQSRNRIVGLRLGRGEKLNDIITSLGSTAEGVSSAELADSLARARNVDAPIVSLVVKTLRGEIAPKDLAKALMSRPLREEF
jgi:glycerol-3-phosphate dehydrogenase (NAD(P)+)